LHIPRSTIHYVVHRRLLVAQNLQNQLV
jgi:hypothetical protein